MADLGDLMKQAKQMQEQMQKQQQEIAKLQVVGESGAGLVKITMNGKHEVKSVELDPSIMEEEREVVEDLIAAAFSDAVKKVADNSKDQLSGLASGFKLPEGFKLPF